MARQTFKVVALADRHAFIKLSARIAVITKALSRKGKNGRLARVVSAYFGFSTQSEAQNFVAGLKRYFPHAYCQIRPAERLTTAIEVKIRDFEGLERFVWEFAANAPIVTPAAPTITPAVAKSDLQQDYPRQPAASNVVSFTDIAPQPLRDRSNAPIAHRTRPKVISGVSID